jgi:hypothetical protein
VATIPIVPRIARKIGLATRESCDTIFLTAEGGGGPSLHRDGSSTRLRHGGISKPISPHTQAYDHHR